MFILSFFLPQTKREKIVLKFFFLINELTINFFIFWRKNESKNFIICNLIYFYSNSFCNGFYFQLPVLIFFIERTFMIVFIVDFYFYSDEHYYFFLFLVYEKWYFYDPWYLHFHCIARVVILALWLTKTADIYLRHSRALYTFIL